MSKQIIKHLLLMNTTELLNDYGDYTPTRVLWCVFISTQINLCYTLKQQAAGILCKKDDSEVRNTSIIIHNNTKYMKIYIHSWSHVCCSLESKIAEEQIVSFL